ncbi:MAG: 5-hydroxyisourate hydrolase [Candidatus Erwinia impunctatus]|nr:5-hydroxyisourate hydrolase [Culicoides impunctatus]
MSSISTHILNIATGKPAAGVDVYLERCIDSGDEKIGHYCTDINGRVSSCSEHSLSAGHYRLTAETGQWFRKQGEKTPFVRAEIEVVIEAEQHYHLPFLIAPGGWSTYRGS